MDKKKDATDVSSEVIYIGKLLDRLAEGKIRIPQFQRPFVWTPSQMCDLLDSIQQRFPIGSVLMWETDRNMSSEDKIGPVDISSNPDQPVSYILDGQQRLSTLLGTLRLPRGSDVSWKWQIYYDLERSTFFHPKNKQPEDSHIPARALLGTLDFLEECRRIINAYEKKGMRDRGSKLVAKAERVADAFRNYSLPIIRITEASLESAVKIFARLNTRGRRITPDQMISALTYTEDGFHLASEIDRILANLSGYGFGGLDRVAILRSVLAAAEEDIYDTDWTNVVEQDKTELDLQEPLRACEEALVKAVDFLRAQGVRSDRLLPYSLQMILLSEFFRLCPDPLPEVQSKLQQWFWVTSFAGWFATFTSSQARIAIEEMRSLATGKRRNIESVTVNAALPFPRRFDARSARVRAFLLFLFSLEPRSLDDGASLEAGGLLSEMGPQALRYIQAGGLPKELHSSPANRILLGPSHRGQAREALLGAADRSDEADVLASHGIPANAIPLLRAGEIENFIQARLEHLIECERVFMEKRQVPPPPDLETAEPDIDAEDHED